MPAFLEATGQHVKEIEAAFRARAEAQRKAWQEAIDKLHKSLRASPTIAATKSRRP